MLHTVARLTHGARTWRRIAEHWPWARDLAAAVARLGALPCPQTC